MIVKATSFSIAMLAALVVGCGGQTQQVSESTGVPIQGAESSPPLTTAKSPVTSPSAEIATSTTVTEATPTTPSAMWGNAEIYVANADGSDERRLTDATSMERNPVWSPDGQSIAYVSWNEREGGVFVMDADGSNIRQLSDVGVSPPVWSPDGRFIAVAGAEEQRYQEIYVVPADGSDATRVTGFERTPTLTLYMGSGWPAWSPDGKQIAFVVEQSDGPSEVYVIDANGANPRRLTDMPGRKMSPRWSPDGARIVFGTDEGGADIWIVNADGTEPRNLTNSDAVDLEPAWSPDGGSVLFTSQIDGEFQIQVIDIGATDAAASVLLSSAAYIWEPVWSPDGSRIAYSQGDREFSDIFAIDADGANLQRLTDAPHSDLSPAWSPDGTRIAFSSDRDGGQPAACNVGSVGDFGPPPSLEALAWASDTIVAGTVVEELPPAFGDPMYRDEPTPTIYTDYIIQVERGIRGDPPEQIRVREPGGTIGDCNQSYEPSLELFEGARLLLFLREAPADTTLPPAWSASAQGTWSVSDDDVISTPSYAYNPLGHDGKTLDEIAALIEQALAGDPPPDAPLEASPTMTK